MRQVFGSKRREYQSDWCWGLREGRVVGPTGQSSGAGRRDDGSEREAVGRGGAHRFVRMFSAATGRGARGDGGGGDCMTQERSGAIVCCASELRRTASRWQLFLVRCPPCSVLGSLAALRAVPSGSATLQLCLNSGLRPGEVAMSRPCWGPPKRSSIGRRLPEQLRSPNSQTFFRWPGVP